MTIGSEKEMMKKLVRYKKWKIEKVCEKCGKEIVENRSYGALMRRKGLDSKLFTCSCLRRFIGERYRR